MILWNLQYASPFREILRMMLHGNCTHFLYFLMTVCLFFTVCFLYQYEVRCLLFGSVSRMRRSTSRTSRKVSVTFTSPCFTMNKTGQVLLQRSTRDNTCTE